MTCYILLTFESVDEIVWCYHSNVTSSVVLSHGTIYLVCSSNFWVCGWNPMVLPFKWNLFSSTFTWYNIYLAWSPNFWVWGWNPTVLPFKWNPFDQRWFQVLCWVYSPVVLGHRRANNSYLISRSTLMERAWILNMWDLPCVETKEISFYPVSNLKQSYV